MHSMNYIMVFMNSFTFMLNNISVKYAKNNNITYVLPNAIKPIL